MENTMSIGDIGIYTNREIQDIYNEATMGIFFEEFNYFKKITKNNIVEESVVLEAEESKGKKILGKIKQFFKDLWEKIKKFFKKIFEFIRKLVHSTEEEKDEKWLKNVKDDLRKAEDKQIKEVIGMKLEYFDKNSISDIIQKGERDVKYYNDKIEGYINNSEVKKIIDFVRKEGSANRQKLADNPQWTSIDHTDRSDMRTQGYYTDLNRDQFEHLYDELLKDIEQYLPFSGETIKMKNESNDKKLRYQYKRKAITSEKDIDDLYNTCNNFKQQAQALDNSIKKIQNQMEKTVKDFEKSLDDVKNFGSITTECVNKVISVLRTGLTKSNTSVANTTKNFEITRRYNKMVMKKIMTVYWGRGSDNVEFDKDENGNRSAKGSNPYQKNYDNGLL